MPEIEECLAKLLEKVETQQNTKMVSLAECDGLILAGDVTAAMMVPPFPKSAMDGYAVRAVDVAGATKETPITLQVTGELLAGDYQEIPYVKNTAVRVMTGAYVPNGFDAVIRQEDTDYGEQNVEIRTSIKPYINYCAVGEDIKKGDVVMKEGTKLSPVHIGLLASLGEERVCVYEPAKVAIISTGTELTEVGKPLLPGKIYNSIAYMLEAAVKREHLQIIGPFTCMDEEELLTRQIKEALSMSDFVITTGAVSVGKKDIIPAVLQNMGAQIIFRGANIQPGTPTMAAMLSEKVILCLSGNPYAALANFEIYFWQAMAKFMHSTSFESKTAQAVLASEYAKVNKHRRLIRGYASDGKVEIPSAVHASSVIHNLTLCNCFIDLEAGRQVKKGEVVQIRYFKN